jgi:CMP-N-acetylneuraminic acid synthetase
MGNKSMKNYGFIFARGGSKGLPRKNVLCLAGKPLIQYSIDTALGVPDIQKVFVSTDDSEIATIAKGAGAIVIDRPKDLAGDRSPEWLSWRHAIEWVTTNYGHFEGFISLPATSPLRAISDVQGAIDKMKNTEADVCISVTPAVRSPFFNMIKKTRGGLVELVNKPQSTISHRQDAPDVFDITTVVYVTTTKFVLESKSIFEGRVTCIEVPKERAVDIDDIYDFKLAEVILNEKR